MEGIIVWCAILIPSAIVGLLCGYLSRGKWGLVIAGAVPWFGLLAALLYTEYLLPYRGGGASMWPVAQLFGGTVAAATGLIACLFSRKYLFRYDLRRIAAVSQRRRKYK